MHVVRVHDIPVGFQASINFWTPICSEAEAAFDDPMLVISMDKIEDKFKPVGSLCDMMLSSNQHQWYKSAQKQ